MAQLTLTVISAPSIDQVNSVFTIQEKPATTLGRSVDCDWSLPDPARYLSSQHALIEYQGGNYFLTDTSTNGVFVNSSKQALGKGKRVQLQHGDCITAGKFKLQVMMGSASAVAASSPAVSAAKTATDAPDMLEQFLDPVEDAGSNDLPGPANDVAPPDAPAPFALDTNSPAPSQQQTDASDLEKYLSQDVPEVDGAPTDASTSDPFDQFLRPPGDPSAESKPATPRKPVTPEPLHSEAIPSGSLPAENVPPPVSNDAIKQVGSAAPPKTSEPRQFASHVQSVLQPSVAKQPDQAVPGGTSPSQDVQPVTPETIQAPSQVEPESSAPPPVQTQATSTPMQDLSDDALMKTFFDSLGLDPHLCSISSEELMKQTGTLLKTFIDGLMQLHLQREKFKSEFHLQQTHIQPSDNNPLKFSANAEEALLNLLLMPRAGYIQGQRAVEEMVKDLKAHEMALISGLTASLEAMAKKLSPEAVEKRNQQQQGGIRMPLKIGQQGANWRLYCILHQELMADADEGFSHLLGGEFMTAYQRQLSKIKQSD